MAEASGSCAAGSSDGITAGSAGWTTVALGLGRSTRVGNGISRNSQEAVHAISSLAGPATGTQQPASGKGAAGAECDEGDRATGEARPAGDVTVVKRDLRLGEEVPGEDRVDDCPEQAAAPQAATLDGA